MAFVDEVGNRVVRVELLDVGFRDTDVAVDFIAEVAGRETVLRLIAGLSSLEDAFPVFERFSAGSNPDFNGGGLTDALAAIVTFLADPLTMGFLLSSVGSGRTFDPPSIEVIDALAL